jgi:DNA topoisomerase VI subunit B
VALRRLAALVVKELVDNALDAGPAAQVENDGDWIYVVDDGLGLPGDAAAIAIAFASLFSIKRPLTSPKMVRVSSFATGCKS